MDPVSPISRPIIVSRDSCESLLAFVAARTPNPLAGIYGPDSMSWRINRESALFLAAGRAALLQLAHPWVAAALRQHSALLDKPIARFHSTFRIVFTMVFGTLDQALAAARSLYARHTFIQGEMPEDAAGWPRGTHYEANEIAALRWVYSTLVESAVIAYEVIHGPLAPSQREQYYDETKTLAALFGIPAGALPQTWPEFADYNQAMHTSDQLGVTADARAMAHNLLSGAGSWIRPPRWYRALTCSWLPERFRHEFGLPFDPRDELAADRATRRLPSLYRRLPSSLRFIGPWHEAQSRLKGRSPWLFDRLSNRFWIGQGTMPFAQK
jgi:uncharacterized protein (DUF2236 family)